MMDEACADVVGGPGLYTSGLATCIGIAVSGIYYTGPDTSDGREEIRCDKFLAHLGDGREMARTWRKLEHMVWHAIVTHRLSEVRVAITVLDTNTLKEDEDVKWTEAMVAHEVAKVKEFMNKAEMLVRGISGGVFMVDRHHVNMARNIDINEKGDIKISDAW